MKNYYLEKLAQRLSGHGALTEEQILKEIIYNYAEDITALARIIDEQAEEIRQIKSGYIRKDIP